MFGGGNSNLPPGVTNRMIEDAYGSEHPCDMCGQRVDDCICPECPMCGSVGDPHCYTADPAMDCVQLNLRHDSPGHGLTRSLAQVVLCAEADRLALEDAEREEAMYRDWDEHEQRAERAANQPLPAAAIENIEREHWLQMREFLAPAKRSVFVLIIEHRYGNAVSAFALEADAHRELVGYCRENWEREELDGECPVDEDELVDAYFDAMSNDEHYSIHECTVEE